MEASETQTNNSWLALSQCLAAGVERVSSSVVAIDARPRVRTSGVVWRPGIVVSTDHTIRRDEEITVTLGDGRSLPAALVGRDAGTDLAVLRVEDGDAASEQGSAQISDAAELRVGHVVLAVGRPDPERGVSASFGIISLLGDKWRTWRGGALIDAEGRVLGINTSGCEKRHSGRLLRAKQPGAAGRGHGRRPHCWV